MPNFTIATSGSIDYKDLTEQVAGLVKESKVIEGVVVVYVTGTTAAVTVGEFEPHILEDFTDLLNQLVPSNQPYKHSDGNAHAHLKGKIIGPDVSIPVKDGKLVLGTWQKIILCDFDPPRTRTVVVKVVGEK